MIGLKNELIRASAGTGKTHALVQRYLWLLAHGAEPERIAAMTFTRKAAGEFFERILQELAKRSTEGADQAASLGLLRKVVRRMDQLRLGTIDSFFATMTQCLPFELGLTGKAALMSDEEALQAGEEVMDALLLAVGKMDDPTAMDELREAWKAASHGYEQGRPAEALATWCGRLHQLLIESPHPGLWGGAEAIWPDQPGRLLSGEGSLAEAVQILQDTLDLKLFGKNAVAKWDEFFTDSLAYDGFRKLSESSIGYMLDPKRGDHSRLRLGDTPWLMWKAATLDLR
ncbi:MAG: UvrD-helicase domain-containing protein, partial [Verrucomicrobium sp.]|nr:UvrD-helicase domain-containing protein [Verrucomicrobium sp.]